MNKQDRQGARTPADLERKYGRRFSEAMDLASDAQKAAEKAEGAVDKMDEMLDQEELFNRLTNYGEVEGIFRDPETGQLYINASYLATGVITSADGTVRIDLGNNTVTIDTTDEDGGVGKLVLTASGINGYGRNPADGTYQHTLKIIPGSFNPKTGEGTATMITSVDSAVGLAIAGAKGEAETRVGQPLGKVVLNSSNVQIAYKNVSWKDNGDGTFTLIGQ